MTAALPQGLQQKYHSSLRPYSLNLATLKTSGFLQVQRLRGEPWESQNSRPAPIFYRFSTYSLLCALQVRGLWWRSELGAALISKSQVETCPVELLLDSLSHSSLTHKQLVIHAAHFFFFFYFVSFSQNLPDANLSEEDFCSNCSNFMSRPQIWAALFESIGSPFCSTNRFDLWHDHWLQFWSQRPLPINFSSFLCCKICIC